MPCLKHAIVILSLLQLLVGPLRAQIRAEGALPERIPCIVEDRSDRWYMTLGDAEVPLRDGFFYPHEDRVLLSLSCC